MRLRRVFLWTMIVSLSLAAALGIVAILFPGFGRTQERILATALLVGGFSLPALASSIVLAKRRLVMVMWAGILSTLAAMALWLSLVWMEPWLYANNDWAEFIIRAGTPFTVMSILASHVGLLALLRLDRSPFRAVRTLTVACAVLLGLFVVGVVWFEDIDEWSGKTIGVLSILTACGTIVTPVLGLIEHLQRRGSRESIPSSVKIDLTCPRCRTSQTLPAGSARCVQCGLRIDIDVEEPRCECGYLLYQLKGDKCPECGRMIVDAAAWRTTSVADSSGGF